LTATEDSPKFTARLGATQSSDGTVDRHVSLHRLWTVVWTQRPGTTKIGDRGTDNTRGNYILMLSFRNSFRIKAQWLIYLPYAVSLRQAAYFSQKVFLCVRRFSQNYQSIP